MPWLIILLLLYVIFWTNKEWRKEREKNRVAILGWAQEIVHLDPAIREARLKYLEVSQLNARLIGDVITNDWYTQTSEGEAVYIGLHKDVYKNATYAIEKYEEKSGSLPYPPPFRYTNDAEKSKVHGRVKQVFEELGIEFKEEEEEME